MQVTVTVLDPDTYKNVNRHFEEVYQVNESAHFLAVVVTDDGKTVEHMIPLRDIVEVTTFHDEDLVGQIEKAKEQFEKERQLANSKLSLV